MNETKIEFNRCKECLYCMTFCPKKVFEPGDELNGNGYYTPKVARQESCVACAICARSCPEGAISIYKK